MRKYKELNYSKNQKQLMQIIFNEREITRQELALKSSFSMLTVSKFVSTFLSDGIICETGTMESTGGRKPNTLAINTSFAYTLAVDIGASHVRVGVVSISGDIIEKEEFPYEKEEIPVKAFQITELAQKLRPYFLKYGADKIIGIGIGISGLVDSVEKKVVFCPNISGYDNVSISDYFEPIFGVPVMLDTSARCMVLAEQRFGAGRGYDNQILVSLGYSISAGIIINGKLFSGTEGFSGEVGHLPVSDNLRQCTCGNYDCLETYATLPIIQERIMHQLMQPGVFSIAKNMAGANGLIDLKLMAQALCSGDKVIYQVITEVGDEIGKVLTSLINILNPQLIVFGGGVIETFPSLLDEISRKIKQKSLITNQHNLRILRSTLGFDGALIGSATQVINHFFE
jgi:predicted NBD/HSP70 family sugar kinase